MLLRLLSKTCFCLLLAMTSLGASGAEPKRVLFIHSFGRDFSPYHTVSGLIRTELASQICGQTRQWSRMGPSLRAHVPVPQVMTSHPAHPIP